MLASFLPPLFALAAEIVPQRALRLTIVFVVNYTKVTRVEDYFSGKHFIYLRSIEMYKYPISSSPWPPLLRTACYLNHFRALYVQYID